MFDLFSEERERESLLVREHSKDGFYVEGCNTVACVDRKVAFKMLSIAMRNRRIAQHDMNSRYVDNFRPIFRFAKRAMTRSREG